MLSAKTQASLTELVTQYAGWLGEHSEASLADICYTTQVGRSHHGQRLAWLVKSNEELLERLRGYSEGEVADSQPRQVAFLFSGTLRGSDWVSGLYELSHAFRACLDQNVSSRDRLLAGKSDRLGAFALGNALSSLWTSMGVEPALVFGQGVGEYTAAVAAGVFGVDEALALLKAEDDGERQAVVKRLNLAPPTARFLLERRRSGWTGP